MQSRKIATNKVSNVKVAVAAVGQVVPNAAVTVIQFTDVSHDILNEFDDVTTFQFSPIREGYYFICAKLHVGLVPIGVSIVLTLRLNLGALILDSQTFTVSAAGAHNLIVMNIAHLTPNDIVDATFWHNNPPNLTLTGTQANTAILIHRID